MQRVVAVTAVLLAAVVCTVLLSGDAIMPAGADIEYRVRNSSNASQVAPP